MINSPSDNVKKVYVCYQAVLADPLDLLRQRLPDLYRPSHPVHQVNLEDLWRLVVLVIRQIHALRVNLGDLDHLKSNFLPELKSNLISFILFNLTLKMKNYTYYIKIFNTVSLELLTVY